MDKNNFGILKINSAKIFSYIGLYEKEKTDGNYFEFDLEIRLDFSDAAKTDEISLTADYNKIYNEVRIYIENSKANLLEKVVVEITDIILENYPNIYSLKTSLRKLNPPVNGLVQSIEAIYFKARDE